MESPSNDDSDAAPARHPLGIGSRFSTSADGRLQGGSFLGGLAQASGALQGVAAQVPSSPTQEGPSEPNSISDAIMMSRPPRGRTKLYSISDEADLASGRGDYVQGPAAAASFTGSGGLPQLPPGAATPPGAAADGPVTPKARRVLLPDATNPPAPVTEPRKGTAPKLVDAKAKTMAESRGEEQIRREKHLLAQIKELERQLDKEKLRKKEQAKASKPREKRRLIVCSRRLPYHLVRDDAGRLELAASYADERSTKLAAYESVQQRLDVTWVGCPFTSAAGVGPGVGADSQFCDLSILPGSEEAEQAREALAKVHCVPVLLPPEQLERAEVLSAEVLWPLFHYIPLSMLESDTDMIHQRWEDYSKLNQAFADEIARWCKPSDIIIVHDYHLMLLPKILREASKAAHKTKIGWFLHTPFPSSEIYQTLPLRKEILRGVLSANLVGFQIYDYVRHFMNASSRVLGTDVSVESKYIIDSAHQTAVTVDAFPCGIDCVKFERMLESPELKDKVIELQRRFDGKKLLLGVDRMDYVKGIPHKLLALEKLLESHPSWATQLQLVQIATPPKNDTWRYHKLRNKVHKLVGRINGRFGTLEHAPIHYLDKTVDFCELCALYFLSDVLLITSLREGMSKVAFEYIACQQKNHGVVVLSEFVGAAQTLGSGALLVNPFNTDEVAKALYEALHMERQEREERHQYMVEYVMRFNAQHWADDFVTDLLTQEQDHEELRKPLAEPTPLPTSAMLDAYKSSSKRLIVLGVLGTLIDYEAFRGMQPLNDDLFRDLQALSSDPRNTVVVMSGRERALVTQCIGDLPVWIVAENGLYHRLGGRGAEWGCMLPDFDDSWIGSIKPVFKYFEERTPGSVTETQEGSITWHYREADEDFGEIQASDLQMHLERVLSNEPVAIALDAKQVQVRPYGVTKGAALEKVVESCTDYRPVDAQLSTDEAKLERDTGSASCATSERATRAPSEAGDHAHAAIDVDEFAALPPSAVAAAAAAAMAAAAAAKEGQPSAVTASSASLAGGSSRGGAAAASAAAALAGALSAEDIESRRSRLSFDAEEEHEEHEEHEVALDFVLCLGRHCLRDEDLFGNLLSHDTAEVPYADYLPGPDQLFTCRVGAQPSQARHFVEDEREVASVLASLASLSQQLPPEEPEPKDGRGATSKDGAPAAGEAVAAPPLAPSALRHMVEIEELMRDKTLCFFLDYDGTLTPIVDNPFEAKLSEEARAVLRRLAARYKTAIVSGRARTTAHGLVQLDELYYAGSHGFDIAGPQRQAGAEGGDGADGGDNMAISYMAADSYRPALEAAKQQAEEMLGDIKGMVVEDNTFSVSVHYRMVAEGEDRERVTEVVDRLVAEMPMLRKTYGKLVYELRPSVDWHKGKAVEWLMEQFKKAAAADEDFFPVYIGDDVTDEDAFAVMGDLGGIGICVSETARDTKARYGLRTPLEVVEFLEHFAISDSFGSELGDGTESSVSMAGSLSSLASRTRNVSLSSLSAASSVPGCTQSAASSSLVSPVSGGGKLT